MPGADKATLILRKVSLLSQSKEGRGQTHPEGKQTGDFPPIGFQEPREGSFYKNVPAARRFRLCRLLVSMP